MNTEQGPNPEGEEPNSPFAQVCFPDSVDINHDVNQISTYSVCGKKYI